jgi:hypothetical protein
MQVIMYSISSSVSSGYMGMATDSLASFSATGKLIEF